MVSMMPAPRVERRALSPHSSQKRIAPLITILLTGLMSVALGACGATSTPTVKSSLPAVPPAPGMILLRDQVAGANPSNQSSTLSDVEAVNLPNGRVLWRHTESLPAAQVKESSPVLQPVLEVGLVYVPQNYQGMHDETSFGELIALDSATGQARWRYKVVPTNPKFNTDLESEPVEANGVVYLTASAYVPGGPSGAPPAPQRVYYVLVQALNSQTGALLWSRTLRGNSSTPAVAGGYVIVLDDDGLTALRTGDGSIAWTFQPGGAYANLDDGGPPNDGYSVQEGIPGPVIVNHLVLVDANAYNGDNPSLGASWFAVSISTGKLVWRSSLDASVVVYTRPVLNQSGDVLCVTGSKLQAPSVVQGLSPASGKTLWSHTIDFELSMCGVSGNTFYLSERNVTGSLGGLLAFDGHSGMQLWQTATARPGGSSGASAPPQEDGLAEMPSIGPSTSGQYFVTGPVVVIQLTTGKVLWLQNLPVDVLRPILVVDNLVLVPLDASASTNFREQLAAYSLQAGSETWTLQL